MARKNETVRLSEKEKDILRRIGQKVTGSPNLSAGIRESLNAYPGSIPRLKVFTKTNNIH